MSNQGLRQASVRAVTGTSYSYEGDFHALFDLAGIGPGDFNGRFLAWINNNLGSSYNNLPSAMQALAAANGAYNFDSLGTFNAGATFAPTDIAGLQLWLDANDTATITDAGAGAVSQWNDKSGNLNHATQSISGRRPVTGTQTINSKNTIYFDGTDYLALPSALYSIPAGANTVFIVTTSEELTPAILASRILSGKVTTNTNFGAITSPNAGTVQYRNSTSANTTAYATTLDVNPHIFGGYRSGTTQQPFYDGQRSGNTSAANQTLTELTIGWDVSITAGQGMIGKFAEIVIYNASLTDSEKNQLGAYFATKWGVTWTPI